MTIDECAKNLAAHFLEAASRAINEPAGTASVEDFAEAILDELKALVLTETDRCAGICDEVGSKSIGHHERYIAGCRACREAILRTSPGMAARIAEMASTDETLQVATADYDGLLRKLKDA